MRYRRAAALLPVALLLVSTAPPARASADVPPAAFADPARRARLLAALPAAEKAVAAAVEKNRFPAAAFGVVVDGELVLANGWGAHGPAGGAVDANAVFRIASMTKSFTALAILKLRDEGKLALDDAVAKWVPELAGLPKATADSPVLTIRHLLTHSEGFPEDNPWGDRQLARSDSFLSAMARAGIPFSNAPGVAFEYSNTGYALLGRVVANVSKMRYRDYVDANILKPLGMTSTYWEASAVPPGRLVRGMRLEGETPVEEPLLGDGAFGAMGGLLSTVRDLARYTAYFLSAWPPRDDADAGPVSRASLREMQQAARATSASARPAADGKPLRLTAGGYGYGLNDRTSCSFRHVVAHGGGLPGYGSLMLWLPEHGVALVALANLRYAGWSGIFSDALDALAAGGGLKARVPQPSPALRAAYGAVNGLYARWDDAAFDGLAADNLVLDRPKEKRRGEFADLRAKHGACVPRALEAENAMRGAWTLACERGEIVLNVTLAPTQPPKIQLLEAKPGPAPAAGEPCRP
ncbi:MAG: serine hydrolase domain-containing protein [Acidobacteriota bacterium]